MMGGELQAVNLGSQPLPIVAEKFQTAAQRRGRQSTLAR